MYKPLYPQRKSEVGGLPKWGWLVPVGCFVCFANVWVANFKHFRYETYIWGAFKVIHHSPFLNNKPPGKYCYTLWRWHHTPILQNLDNLMIRLIKDNALEKQAQRWQKKKNCHRKMIK